MTKIIHMLFAIAIVFITFLVSLVEPKITKKSSRKVLLVIIGVISLFLAFRDIGLDLEPYRRLFASQGILSITDLVNGGLFSGRLEPVFSLLISFLKRYSFGFNHFLFVVGTIPMIIVYKVITEVEEKHVLLTFTLFLLMYFFSGPIDVIRHFFAASIYLSAILSLSKGKKMAYWIKVILSVFSHYSNIMIVLMKPFLKHRWSKRGFFLSIAVVSILGVVGKFSFHFLSEMDFWDSNNGIIWKLGYYLTYYDSIGYQYTGSLHRVLLFIMNYFPLVFSVVITEAALSRVDLVKKSIFKSMLLNSQIIGILLFVFFIFIGAFTLGKRIHFLLNIGSFFIVKEVVVSSRKESDMRYGLTVLFLAFYNFIFVLYYAGIHDPMSPFFLFL